MLLVPVKTLRAGMELAQPVYHPACDDVVLLAADYTLTEKMIARLNDFAINHAWIKVAGLEELDRKIANPKISQTHADLLKLFNGSAAKLDDRVAGKFNLDRYKRVVQQMLQEIVTNPDHQIITDQLASCSPQLSGHFANVCYLSLLIGTHMSGYLRQERKALPIDIAQNTASLGVGALMHDIGKMYMHDDLQNCHILKEESDWPEYRMHVRAGYEAIREQVSAPVANVILNHHQRFDGTGFPTRKKRGSSDPPRPLAGRNIHIFSRIVGVVDAFDHLLCPEGVIQPTIIALHTLRGEGFQGWFDPVVVDSLCQLVPPFMIGSVVTLSDGQEAVVTANHPEAPCKPMVKILNDPITEGGVPVARKQLDLRMSRNVTIAAIDEIDVSNYLFAGEMEPEPAVWN